MSSTCSSPRVLVTGHAIDEDGSVSDFFPDPPGAPDDGDDDVPPPVWMNPPDDVLPGVVPVELVLGRSDEAVVMLSGMRAFPTGVAMTLLVRTRTRTKRFSLHEPRWIEAEVRAATMRYETTGSRRDAVWEDDAYRTGQGQPAGGQTSGRLHHP